MAKKDISVVVCGRFHYHRYLAFLSNEGRLAKAYFSHKLVETLGVPGELRVNLFLKEYFLQGLIRFLGMRRWLFPLAHIVWSASLWFTFAPTRKNLFLLHGNSMLAMRRARVSGNCVVGEAVNIHPLELNALLSQECERCGLPFEPVRNSSAIAAEASYVDLVLCPSTLVADSYVRQGIPVERIRVLRYAFEQRLKEYNPPRRRERPLSPGGTIKILCVGQLGVRKAQHRLFDSLDSVNWRLSGHPVHLVLVGVSETGYLEYLRGRRADFQHIEHIPSENMMQFMALHDILVLPSVEDGFGLVVIEAIGAGVPVVVSKYAGVSELLADIPSAFIVDPTDCSDLAQALNLSSKRAIESDNEADLDFILPQRSWSEYASDLASTLDEFCGLSGSRR